MTSFSELERLALERRPTLAHSAPGSASYEALSALRGQVGDIPPPLLDLLAWRNGSPSDSWFGVGFWYLLPAVEIGCLYSEWKSKRVRCAHIVEGEREVIRGWPTMWIPFATWSGNVFAIIDGRRIGEFPVIGIDFEAGRITKWSSSFDGFIEIAVSRIRAHGELVLLCH